MQTASLVKSIILLTFKCLQGTSILGILLSVEMCTHPTFLLLNFIGICSERSKSFICLNT